MQKENLNLLLNDQLLYQEYSFLAGVDEAGRGPLAGPVVVAAVILDPNKPIMGLRDSKKLSKNKRFELYRLIKEYALHYSIAIISSEEIDKINILQATLKGMSQTILALKPSPSLTLIDGNQTPSVPSSYLLRTVVKGDDIYACIAAASIIAKETRDAIMLQLDLEYPLYNFKANKGYPTAEHLSALRKYGCTPHHRKSFGPVQQLELEF